MSVARHDEQQAAAVVRLGDRATGAVRKDPVMGAADQQLSDRGTG